MELKYYGKPWLQAFKGAFFIILGSLLLLGIQGSINTLSVLFSFFIGLTGFFIDRGANSLKDKRKPGVEYYTRNISLVFCGTDNY